MQQASGEHPYDLAIIGSGGAAFAAAIAARRKDRRVVMVERGRIGGTCVNAGCVPSKALLAAAQARHVAAEAGQRFPGISSTAGPVHPVALLVGKQALVEQLQAHKYIDLAAAYGWEVVAGQARCIPDPGDGGGPALQVDQVDGGTRRIQAAYYLVATGSAPLAPPIPGLEEVGYLTSTTAMELTELPGSLLLVGGNAVGLEVAQLFARLGTKVSVVELLDRLAPLECSRTKASLCTPAPSSPTWRVTQAARRWWPPCTTATVAPGSCGPSGCWSPPAAAPSPTGSAWRRWASRSASAARSWSTSSSAPTIPGSGPPGTSPERRSSSTSQRRTARWSPTTL